MEGNGELRARLEEYFRDDKRRDGQVVFEDMAPYQELSEIASNDAHDPVPTLRFESRFESGNLLRAVQVGFAFNNINVMIMQLMLPLPNVIYTQAIGFSLQQT